MKYYHGTTDIFNLKEILPPIETDILRENWRTKYLDKIFLTTSLLSAQQYACKACKIFSGNGIVYEVEPIGDIWFPNPYTNEYLADKGKIKGIACIYDKGLKKWI